MTKVFSYPELTHLDQELGFLAIGNNNPKGIPTKSVLIGHDGAGKHYHIKQTLNNIISSTNQSSDQWEIFDCQISSSGQINQEYWGEKIKQHIFSKNHVNSLQKLLLNISLSLGPVSTPSLQDIFPSLIANTSKRLIVIENEYKSLNFDNWLINLILSQEDAHYLLVFSDPPQQIVTKLDVLKHSLVLVVTQMPKLPPNVMTLDLDSNAYKAIRQAIKNVARLMHCDTDSVVKQFRSRPGMIFKLANMKSKTNFRDVLKKLIAGLSLTEDCLKTVHSVLRLLNDGTTEEDLAQLIGADKALHIFKYLRKEHLIETIQGIDRLGPVLRLYYQTLDKPIPNHIAKRIDQIFKRKMPWNYAIRAKIAKAAECELETDSFLALDALRVNSANLQYNSDNSHVRLAVQLHEATLKDKATDIESLRQSSYQLLNCSEPLLLKAQFYLILIQYAKKARIESLLTIAIEEAIPIYIQLRKNEEYEMQFRLGLELAPDIRNYNLDRHYLDSGHMFADLHYLLDDSKVDWPNDIRLTFKIMLTRHEGVFNNMETQRSQLKDLLSDEVASSLNKGERLRLLTNLVGIDMCRSISPSNQKNLPYIDQLNQCLKDTQPTFKACNNLAIGRYFQGKIELKDVIHYLCKHCYSNSELTDIASNPIPKTSHKVIHMNLALLLAEEDMKYIPQSLSMLSITLNNAPQDDFYRFYVEYNRLMLKFKNRTISKYRLQNRLAKLQVPALFEGLESGDMLYRRLDNLNQLLESTAIKNYSNLTRKYQKQIRNAAWQSSLLSQSLLLYSDLQYWD
ncbi:hypothetical protein [Loigolactobacillus iwatensis]|uniref:hypothetical protein n=1 Tax=Loigolactobacillus iwatensis TaxID=1267156 RepID=UPI000F7D7BED|nr:hypothetical protein [Loigolactobacillus iwatensis]